MESVSLPNSITHIGEKAFHQCTELSSATLPSSLTHVGVNAFSKCVKLKRVARYTSSVRQQQGGGLTSTRGDTVSGMPKKLTHIGDYAFAMCYALREVSDCDARV